MTHRYKLIWLGKAHLYNRMNLDRWRRLMAKYLGAEQVDELGELSEAGVDGLIDEIKRTGQ